MWYFSLCDFSLSNFVNTRYLLLLLLLLTRLHEIIQDREGSIIDLHNLVDHRAALVRPCKRAIRQVNAGSDRCQCDRLGHREVHAILVQEVVVRSRVHNEKERDQHEDHDAGGKCSGSRLGRPLSQPYLLGKSFAKDEGCEIQ
mgnify:CR=1 FL=1